jgi:hypothetical protein
MSIFADALAAAREAVTGTYAQPMIVTAMVASEYRGASPDPARPAFTVPGILHEHVVQRRGVDEATLVERTDGGRPGGRFGVDVAAAPIRISFDLVDLGGWEPPSNTRITVEASGRVFEVTHPAPRAAERIVLFVTEISP